MGALAFGRPEHRGDVCSLGKSLKARIDCLDGGRRIGSASAGARSSRIISMPRSPETLRWLAVPMSAVSRNSDVAGCIPQFDRRARRRRTNARSKAMEMRWCNDLLVHGHACNVINGGAAVTFKVDGLLCLELLSGCFRIDQLPFPAITGHRYHQRAHAHGLVTSHLL